VFVHDRGAPNQVFAYQLGATGTLTAVPGSPFATGAGNTGAVFCRGNCQSAAYSAKRRLLFVSGTTGISALVVATNGSLTPVAGSPFGPAGDYVGVTVLQKGRNTFVYAAEVSQNRIRGFKVETSGALTEIAGSPFATGATPVALAGAPGKVFNINQGDGTITHFKSQPNGALVSRYSTAVGTTGVFTLYTDPKGKYVYAPENVNGNEVFAFKVGASSFSGLTGSPFSSDVQTSSGLVFGTPYLFAMSLRSTVTDDVQVYRRTAKGTLQKLVVQSSGLLGIRSGAVNKKRLVLASDDGDTVRSYTIATNGMLTVVDSEAAGIDFANQVLIVRR